jgi:hypothetical protein
MFYISDINHATVIAFFWDRKKAARRQTVEDFSHRFISDTKAAHNGTTTKQAGNCIIRPTVRKKIDIGSKQCE